MSFKMLSEAEFLAKMEAHMKINVCVTENVQQENHGGAKGNTSTASQNSTDLQGQEPVMTYKLPPMVFFRRSSDDPDFYKVAPNVPDSKGPSNTNSNGAAGSANAQGGTGSSKGVKKRKSGQQDEGATAETKKQNKGQQDKEEPPPPKELKLTKEQVVWGPVSSIKKENRVHVVSQIVKRLLNANAEFKAYFEGKAKTFNEKIANMSEKPSKADWESMKKDMLTSLSQKIEVQNLVHTVSLTSTPKDGGGEHINVAVDNEIAGALKPPAD